MHVALRALMHVAFDFLAVAAVIGGLCAISLKAPRS